jgi:probable HAF family extracellular repeat protein
LWLNDAGELVGYADLPPNPPGCTGLTCVHHAFLWKQGVMTDLGTIGTDPCSRAVSVNSKGQVVGFTAAVCGGNATHGFLWEDGGPAIDLNTLVPPGSSIALTTPAYINDRGEIAGSGALSNGDTHAFLLIPCDENYANTEGCEDQIEGTPAVRGDASERPKIALPENAPSILRQRLGHWYHIPGLEASEY